MMKRKVKCHNAGKNLKTRRTSNSGKVLGGFCKNTKGKLKKGYRYVKGGRIVKTKK